MNIIGRDKERHVLEKMLRSTSPEFLAVYGRRRIGKTFLIREFFQSQKVIFMNVTGAKDAPLPEQIEHFMEQMGEAFFGSITPKAGKNWNATFKILTGAIQSVPKSKKIVLFFDEFPWMATKNSRLLQNLDYYWNQHWSKDSRIKLIICGSSASWIVKKIIQNRGGLHNRVTETMRLESLNLREAKNYLHHKGVKLNNQQVLQLYMAIGGIPYYLNKVEKGLTAAQVIEQLAFKKNSFLLDEFNSLFSSLFESHEHYIAIIKAIASTRYGIGQDALFKKIDASLKGYSGLNKLEALEKSGFIMSFLPYSHKSKGVYYKIIDEYTLFYFHWIEPIKQTLLKEGARKGYWEEMQLSSAWRSWSGYTFESICYKHLFQIGQALNLSPTAIPTTWRYVPEKNSAENGAQIDLLFDRNDGAITICEIKYTATPFYIDKEYAKNLQNKLEVFSSRTKTNKQLFIAMITASGLKPSMYSEELVSATATLEDLFKEEV